MISTLNPYLNFNGQARQAMEFYKTVFGGKLTMSTFKEAGMTVDPADSDRIMHAALIADNGITLMASDTPKGWDYSPGNNVSNSLSGENDSELRGYWDRLSQGATIAMPLSAAPWGDTFGMLDDKFGIRWMVNITGKRSS
jgi:PhnB protein